MAAKRLPERPNLEHYRRQAKDLLKALAAAEPAALERWRQYHPRGSASGAKLADAQLILAREHGFASWPQFIVRLGGTASVLPAKSRQALLCENGALDLEVRPAAGARGLVLFLSAGQTARQSLGTRQVADRLNAAGYCTVTPSLLTGVELTEDALNETFRFDIPLLTRRAEIVLDWIGSVAELSALPLALFCMGTGAAAGVGLAARHSGKVAAIVSCGGRPDLQGAAIARVRSPSLFIVGGDDAVAHGFTKLMLQIFPQDVPHHLQIANGVGLSFNEGPAAARASEWTIAWLESHLVGELA